MTVARAHAQPAAPAPNGEAQPAAAEALFRQALDLMANGRWADACPKLVESQRLDPGPGTLMNLGRCYEGQSRLASAWAAYVDAAAFADRAGRKEWQLKAVEKADQLAPRLARLVVEVTPGEASADLELTRDGAVIGRAQWGVPIPVDAGEHVIAAHDPRAEPWSQRTSIADGASVTVTVPKLRAKPQTVAAPSAERGASPDDGTTLRRVGYGVSALGVAGLGTGAVFGALAMGNTSDGKSLCPNFPSACGAGAEGRAAFDAARWQADVSTAAFIVGGALVLGGVLLVILAPSARPRMAADASLRF